MDASEKLLAGAELFDYACSITIAGIRGQHPRATNEQVLDMLRQRLQLRERAEGRA